MASLLDKSLFQRNVTAFLRQRNDDLYDVVISCTNSDRAERALKYLTDAGFEEGAPPTKDLILQEGQSLYVKFRGNVTCITENPKLSLIYNTHMKCSTELKVTEKDVFAQKGLHCYRGFAQVFTKSLVPVPVQDGTKKPTELPDMVEAEVLLAELLIEIPKVCYSLLCPFLCFTTNQFAQKLKFVANLIKYFVNICNIYYWSKRRFPKEQPELGKKQSISKS